MILFNCREIDVRYFLSTSDGTIHYFDLINEEIRPITWWMKIKYSLFGGMQTFIDDDSVFGIPYDGYFYMFHYVDDTFTKRVPHNLS